MGSMTPDQRLVFRERGCLALPGALPQKQIGKLREQILDELKRLKIWSSGKRLSSRLDGIPAFQQITKLGQSTRLPELQARIITPELSSIIDTLGGVKLISARDARLLISLPQPNAWTLDGLDWHVDISSPDPRRLPGIQAFVLVDDVRVRGGATLAVAGSHLLDERGEAKAKILEILGASGDVEARLRERGLSILEMSGRAGDVYLMDMRLLHTPSINATKHLRIMATARYFAV